MQTEDFYQLHSEMCKTISNPKRQAILDSLRDGELTVNEIAEKTIFLVAEKNYCPFGFLPPKKIMARGEL